MPLGIRQQLSESKVEYKDVVLFAKHYGTLFKKRKSAFMKKVDKLEALACAVSIQFCFLYIYSLLHSLSSGVDRYVIDII